MAITRWDPFGELLSMQRDMDRVFGRLGLTGTARHDGETGWMPKVDVLRRGEDLVVRAELPGVKMEDVDVSVTDNVLTVRGERKEEKETTEEGYLVQESCAYGGFERSIMLPEGVDADSIHAEIKDGVLEVMVLKAARASTPGRARSRSGPGSRSGPVRYTQRCRKAGRRARPSVVSRLRYACHGSDFPVGGQTSGGIAAPNGGNPLRLYRGCPMMPIVGHSSSPAAGRDAACVSSSNRTRTTCASSSDSRSSRSPSKRTICAFWAIAV